MALDNDESPPSPRRSNRFMLVAGLAGACALGVGAGLWARPADIERDPTLAAAKPPEPPKRTGRLQIVLDDSPAPIGQPIEVLPGAAGVQPAAAAPVFQAPEPEPVEMAPRRPATGLVKVQAVSAPMEIAPPPLPRVDPRKAAEAQARREAAAEQARVASLKAEKAEKARLESARLEKVRLQKAKADKAAKAEKLRIAKAEKTERAAESRRLAERAAAAKAEKIQLAKAAKREAEEARLAEAKRANALRRLAHAVAKVVPHRKAEPVELAEAKPPKAKKAAAGKRKCVSPDPGAAIVCADPALASADRQLSRAYRDAEAAGVDAATLERQQQRWLVARSAAAREAPWAVHDVYLARIAELNDLARDARGRGY